MSNWPTKKLGEVKGRRIKIIKENYMAKVNFKDNKSLQSAKNKARGVISYRKTKDGRVVATKWPSRRKKK